MLGAPCICCPGYLPLPSVWTRWTSRSGSWIDPQWALCGELVLVRVLLAVLVLVLVPVRVLQVLALVLVLVAMDVRAHVHVPHLSRWC